MNRLINHVSDNDLYFFHMADFLWHNYRGNKGSFTYKNRDPRIDLSRLIPSIRDQLKMMQELRLNEKEHSHLLLNSHCSKSFLDYLSEKELFNPDMFTMESGSGLIIKYHGDVHDRVFVEEPLLALISELHFRDLYKDRYDEVLRSGEEWVKKQINWLNENAHPKLSILEMGGRRRFSYAHHRKALEMFWNNTKVFKGTTNVHLGMELGIPYFGTMAHLLFMFMQTVYAPQLCNKKTLQEWKKHFPNMKGVALSDTLGNEKWDRDFDLDLSIDYPIERHDSGCPREWADLRIMSALNKNLDLTERGILFSDSLTIKIANDLTSEYSEAINVETGMGTHLTNTMGIDGHKPIPQVSKLTWANGSPTCKLPADVGKGQCEDSVFHDWMKQAARYY